MSVRSWFTFDGQEMNQEIRRETASEADGRKPLVRRSARLKVLNAKGRNLEEDFAEKANALFRSRAGYISTLTRIQGDIETVMCACEETGEVMSRKAKYDDAWRKFVNAHEQYIEYIISREEKEKALLSYERQKIRKLNFDEEVQRWCENLELEVEANAGKKQSGIARTGNLSEMSTRSGRSTAISRKAERLALAKLKVTQLKKQHQLERKMTELKFEKEMMEAQMEEERAAVSFIYEPDNEEEQNLDHYGEDRSQLRDGAMDRSGLKSVNPIQTSETNRETFNFPKELYVSRGLKTEESKPSQKQEDVSRYYVEQPALRRYGQELPELRQNAVSTEICRPQKKVLEKEVWSQEAQATIETDIGGLQPLREQEGNPEVSNQQIGQRGISRFNEQCQPRTTSWPQSSQLPQRTTTSSWPQSSQPPQRYIHRDVESLPRMVDTGEEVIRALRQVVSTPKIKYMHFDGEPVNYISFMHNFETCLEKDNPDNSRKLQLLIQHCTGKAREAVESCVNLPEEYGYQAAKETLRENFGKPHIIAQAYIKKLENLAPLKQVNGQKLLEFARHLEVANRTLAGMGSEYTDELDHVNTLKLLNRKLPGFMRVKWTERAGEIIEGGSRPKFLHFLQFVKRRATLVNNEFGEDLVTFSSDKGGKPKNRDYQRRFGQRTGSSFAARDGSKKREQDDTLPTQRKCPMCSSEHRIWRCDKFRSLPYQEKRRLVQARVLCFKCLCNGHFAKQCPKTQFKCQVQGCNKEHNTLLHPKELSPPSQVRTGKKDLISRSTNTDFDAEEATTQLERAQVSSAIGVGEKVCLSVVPVKVKAKVGAGPVIKTYALLDSGSEVTLCHELLRKNLGVSGKELDFTLSGMTGSTRMNSQLIDITVTSIDNEASVDLSNVRTVTEIPISGSCIAKREDVRSWPHLNDIDLHELNDDDVMLVIGLQEKPALFLPVEYRIGGEMEPIGIRYSLGWTVVGPVGGQKDNEVCSTNFVHTLDNSYITKHIEKSFSAKSVECIDQQSVNLANENSGDPIMGQEMRSLQFSCSWETEIECQRKNDDLNRQLESLWKTDFDGSLLDSKACDSMEDRKALKIMGSTLTMIDGHYQVALPWRYNPPYLPNNKIVALRRAFLLKKRLMKNENLHIKYQETMNNYIEDGHAEKIPKEELEPDDRPVWYVPHHPVVHPLKPDKVRVVYDCAATYKGTSLNQQLMSGPDQTNQLVGVSDKRKLDWLLI